MEEATIINYFLQKSTFHIPKISHLRSLMPYPVRPLTFKLSFKTNTFMPGDTLEFIYSDLPV